MIALRSTLAASLALAAVLVPSLGSHSTGLAATSCVPGTPHGTAPAKALVSAQNAFGIHLFDTLSAEHPGNVVISPTSISLALEMLYEGAKGSTRAAMARVLDIAGLKQEAVGGQAGSLLAALRTGDPKVALRIADSLWLQTGVRVRPHFLWNARYHYGAQVTNLDLQSSGAPPVINAWVSCATSGKISQIVQSTAGQLALLVNAVYFQGIWTEPFQRQQTAPGPFHLNKGSTERVPLMHQLTEYPYFAGPDFQVASLPYGHGRYSMVIVLPRRGESLRQFESRVTYAGWNQWTSALKRTWINLSLPRFTVRNTFFLRKTLSALGMGAAFGGSANFNAACSACHISDVIHKTYLHVFERGTVAAAVTAIPLTGGGRQVPYVTMTVDHPFLLAIRDKRTGTILFLGGIDKPA